MKVNPDGAFGVLCAALPLTAGNSPVMDMGSASHRFFATKLAFECHMKLKKLRELSKTRV